MNNIIANLYRLKDSEVQWLYNQLRSCLYNSDYVYTSEVLSYEDYMEIVAYEKLVSDEIKERNEHRYGYRYD
jgi:hypothetical protein